MTSNIFDIVIGKGTLKWDAVWRVIEWLSEPAEGHGLGDSFRNEFVNYFFGKECSVKLKVEYFLGVDDVSGKEKWPDIGLGSPTLDDPKHLVLIDDVTNSSPGDSRKINNLVTYARVGRKRFPNAQISIVAITDTTNFNRFSKLQKAFSEENLGECRLLPLHTLATWIETGGDTIEVVNSFKEWANSLEH